MFMTFKREAMACDAHLAAQAITLNVGQNQLTNKALLVSKK